MNIRNAVKADAKAAALLIRSAIEGIAETLTGESEESKILEGLASLFTREDNRLSYRNCLIADQDGKAVGLILIYHGKDAVRLDQPILERLRKKPGKPALLDIEADKDDYYIDTVSVHPDYQDRGIGRQLIAAAEKQARKRKYFSISLNVAKNNPRAKKLYFNLGYVKKKEMKISGDLYDYLVKSL
ncbi:GNAT family N-acetyltransferase [Heyndrickxia acidiproducens]|uniref:GNAT family N-acetyltransferase n=1 Tax=Heyndrickxia acidiproducens TaxID=1121084 RepID=UPI00037387C5|nr:GNAT family N-acetyltransferase [Heyndrickxia acidiproducens]